MSFFNNLFSAGNSGNQQTQQKQQLPGNNQPQNNQPNMPQGNGNPTGNAGNNQPQGGNGGNDGNQNQTNPLDAYSKLWDNPQQNGTNQAPSFSIDPKIMDEVTGSQDFTKGINPELVQKALQGDMQSFLDVIQSVGRNSYRASIEHGGLLTDKFVGAREEFSAKGLSGKVRQELTTHALSNTPNFQHPVVRKQLTEIAQQFQRQHPDAQPQEIAEMAKKYLNDLVTAMNPPDTAQNNKQKPGPKGQEFWDDYFDKDDSADFN